MAILRAYALPHPIMAIPAVGRGKEKQMPRTLAAFDIVAQDIAGLRPDTIIFLTPHNVVYDNYFHISPGDKGKGDCKRFGTKHVRLTLKYDPNFAAATAYAAGKYGVSAKTLGERNAPLDHGVMVPLWYINRRYSKFKTMRVSQANLDAEAHYKMGQCLCDAALKIGRRTVVVASGNLSRKIEEKKQSGYVQEALEYDKEMAHIFATGTFQRLFSIPFSQREVADECGYSIFMMMAGCLDRKHVKADLLSYENPFGEGYAVASFDPGSYAENRDFLNKSEKIQRRLVVKARALENSYCTLARRALEYTVLHGLAMPIPVRLPREMLTTRAGAFVSIYMNGRLRGAAGTLDPSTENVATEIAKNAVIAGQSDKRFVPITEKDLSGLVYKVDVIGRPEKILESHQLDTRRYGLIVTNGDKWGAVLPNQRSIKTGDEQILEAKNRAGIDTDAPAMLERFEVYRHE